MEQISWSAYVPLEPGSTNEDPLGFYARLRSDVEGLKKILNSLILMTSK